MKHCNYCGNTKNIKTRHITSCPFNPMNNRKIIQFLESCVIEDRSLIMCEYDKYARKVNIPLSKTIINLLKENNHIDINAEQEIFKQAIIYLIYKSYELNLIDDLEILDILVYKLTYGNFNYTTYELLEKYELINLKANIDTNIIDSNLITLFKVIIN